MWIPSFILELINDMHSSRTDVRLFIKGDRVYLSVPTSHTFYISMYVLSNALLLLLNCVGQSCTSDSAGESLLKQGTMVNNPNFCDT